MAVVVVDIAEFSHELFGPSFVRTNLNRFLTSDEMLNPLVEDRISVNLIYPGPNNLSKLSLSVLV